MVFPILFFPILNCIVFVSFYYFFKIKKKWLFWHFLLKDFFSFENSLWTKFTCSSNPCWNSWEADPFDDFSWRLNLRLSYCPLACCPPHRPDRCCCRSRRRHYCQRQRLPRQPRWPGRTRLRRPARPRWLRPLGRPDFETLVGWQCRLETWCFARVVFEAIADIHGYAWRFFLLLFAWYPK
mgnify:CR=1 FL=1